MDMTVRQKFGRPTPAIIADRLRRQTDLTRPQSVRVVATQEKYRRHVKHGVSGQRFLPDINSSVEWPNDNFTYRRLKEGSVRLADDQGNQPERAQSPQQRRRHEGRSAAQPSSSSSS